MNEYESVIIIKPNLEEGEIEGIVTEITDLINQDGEVTKVEKMGIKKLAYEIKKNKEGYYIIFYFEAKADVIFELERNYRDRKSVV